MKVLITTNIPAPYFVNYANELSKYVDLTVAFELEKATDRDIKWDKEESRFNFKYINLKALRINNESGLSFKVIKLIKKEKFDRIIIANPTTLTGIATLLYLRKHKIHFIIQSEGGFRKSGNGLKEKFKKYIMEKADYYLTGMGGEDDYFLSYGATPSKLKKYNFTSLYKKDILLNPPSTTIKNKQKETLNIKTNYLILYVGQFIDRKNIPILLKSFQGIKDSTLVLIGGNPSREYIDLIKKLKLKNIIFLPFISQQELSKYYIAADLFVLPTKEDTWGLVINEAMAKGLPIISTNKCIAAKQLIKDGTNGYIVNPYDYVSINTYIKKIINNEKLRNQIAINNINKINSYTIENMGRTISELIK